MNREDFIQYCAIELFKGEFRQWDIDKRIAANCVAAAETLWGAVEQAASAPKRAEDPGVEL